MSEKAVVSGGTREARRGRPGRGARPPLAAGVGAHRRPYARGVLPKLSRARGAVSYPSIQATVPSTSIRKVELLGLVWVGRRAPVWKFLHIHQPVAGVDPIQGWQVRLQRVRERGVHDTAGSAFRRGGGYGAHRLRRADLVCENCGHGMGFELDKLRRSHYRWFVGSGNGSSNVPD